MKDKGERYNELIIEPIVLNAIDKRRLIAILIKNM
jgi:hypothetical protein